MPSFKPCSTTKPPALPSPLDRGASDTPSERRNTHPNSAGANSATLGVPSPPSVKHVVSLNRQLVTGLQIHKGYCRDVITFHCGSDWPMTHQATQQPSGLSRPQLLVKYFAKDRRLRAQITDPSRARIEVRIPPGDRCELPRLPVQRSD